MHTPVRQADRGELSPVPETNPFGVEARGRARDFIRRTTAEDDLRFVLLCGIQQRLDRRPGRH
jgi:hypothetical protein